MTKDRLTRVDTAADFARRLGALRAASGQVPMRDIFALAKESSGMDPAEIEALLEADDHELRVGAVSVMDFQARGRSTSEARRRELYELYLRRHDRIDTWDLVDRAAPYVVGGYLSDKPRDPLYVLARSNDWWERRSAIVATYFFIRQDDLDDTFTIADILADDPEDLVQKAVGGWVREAGKRDPGRLIEFLDRHARTMPRTALRYAVEHLDAETRRHYMQLR
jgi:3-methyladenine DNA glycosylase AlkD